MTPGLNSERSQLVRRFEQYGKIRVPWQFRRCLTSLSVRQGPSPRVVDARSRPSGEKATDWTEFEWPSRVCNSALQLSLTCANWSISLESLTKTLYGLLPIEVRIPAQRNKSKRAPFRYLAIFQDKAVYIQSPLRKNHYGLWRSRTNCSEGQVANWSTGVWCLMKHSFSLQQSGFHAVDRTSSSFLL